MADDAMHLRVGIGHDTHRLGSKRPLRIGGVEIPHTTGLIGHSDADVLLHALTDAVLGAVGAGDIGEWFPDSDEANKDRDSKEMLREVITRAMPSGSRLINVDCTVFAELPRLTAHKPSIREALSTLLGIPCDRVNVKAKSGENVGPIGRSEAISAQVAVLVQLAAGS